MGSHGEYKRRSLQLASYKDLHNGYSWERTQSLKDLLNGEVFFQNPPFVLSKE